VVRRACGFKDWHTDQRCAVHSNCCTPAQPRHHVRALVVCVCVSFLVVAFSTSSWLSLPPACCLPCHTDLVCMSSFLQPALSRFASTTLHCFQLPSSGVVACLSRARALFRRLAARVTTDCCRTPVQSSWTWPAVFLCTRIIAHAAVFSVYPLSIPAIRITTSHRCVMPHLLHCDCAHHRTSLSSEGTLCVHPGSYIGTFIRCSSFKLFTLSIGRISYVQPMILWHRRATASTLAASV
jgi:hypothetical protein